MFTDCFCTLRYCFGGAVAVRFGDGKYFQSLVICHPGGINLEQIKGIKVPTSWACAEGMYLSSLPAEGTINL